MFFPQASPSFTHCWHCSLLVSYNLPYTLNSAAAATNSCTDSLPSTLPIYCMLNCRSYTKECRTVPAPQSLLACYLFRLVKKHRPQWRLAPCRALSIWNWCIMGSKSWIWFLCHPDVTHASFHSFTMNAVFLLFEIITTKANSCPSIHYLNFFSFYGSQWCWSQRAPWTGHQPVTGLTYRNRQSFTFTPVGDLQSPINPTAT